MLSNNAFTAPLSWASAVYELCRDVLVDGDAVDELVVAECVRVGFQHPIQEDWYEDALRIAKAAQTLRSARQNQAGAWRAVANQNLAPPELADTAEQQADAVAAALRSWSIKDGVIANVNGAERQAAVLKTLGIAPEFSIEVMLELGKNTSVDHVEWFDKAMGLIKEVPGSMRTLFFDPGIHARLSGLGLPSHFVTVIRAELNELDEDVPPLPDDAVRQAQHRHWRACKVIGSLSGGYDITAIDEAVAALVSSVVGLTQAQRATMNQGPPVEPDAPTGPPPDPLYVSAIFSLKNGPAWASLIAEAAWLETLHSQSDQQLIDNIYDYAVRRPAATIEYPRTYVAWVSYKLRQLGNAVLLVGNTDSVTASPQSQMRLLRARSTLKVGETLDVSFTDSGHEQTAQQLHSQVNNDIARSIQGLFSTRGEANAEVVRDGLYGAMSLDEFGKQYTLREADRIYARARAEHMLEVRNWWSGLIDIYSYAGYEVDEVGSVMDTYLQRIRLGTTLKGHPLRDAVINNPTTQNIERLHKAEHTRLISLTTEAFKRGQEFVGVRHEVADLAAGAVGMAAALGAVMILDGAGAAASAVSLYPLLYGTVGPAAAVVVTRYVIEGPRYIDTVPVSQEAMWAAFEGLFDGLTGAGLGKVVSTARLYQDSASVGKRTLARIASAFDADAATPGLQRVVARSLESVAEGAAGGGLSFSLQTALDRSTWDQSALGSLADIMYAYATGALTAATVGGVLGGSIGALSSRFGGEARAGRMMRWFVDNGKADWLKTLPEADWNTVAEAVALAERGLIIDAENLIGNLAANYPGLELIQSIIDPLRSTAGIRRALDGLGDLVLQMDNVLGPHANVLRGLNVQVVPASSFRNPAARGGAEIRITVVDGEPQVTVLIDSATLEPNLLPEELVHFFDIRFAPETKKWWSRLTDEALENWSTMGTQDKLLAREAYLQMEIRAAERIKNTSSDPTTVEQATAELDVLNDELDAVTLAKNGDPTALGRVKLYEPPYLNARKPVRFLADGSGLKCPNNATTPTVAPLDRVLEGPQTSVAARASESVVDLERENRAGEVLAAHLYAVRRNPRAEIPPIPDTPGVPGSGTPKRPGVTDLQMVDVGLREKARPDYLIDGNFFDCYSPRDYQSTGNLYSPVQNALGKVETNQTRRVVIYLHPDRSQAQWRTPEEWRAEVLSQLRADPEVREKLEEIILIYDRPSADAEIFRIYGDSSVTPLN